MWWGSSSSWCQQRLSKQKFEKVQSEGVCSVISVREPPRTLAADETSLPDAPSMGDSLGGLSTETLRPSVPLQRHSSHRDGDRSGLAISTRWERAACLLKCFILFFLLGYRPFLLILEVLYVFWIQTVCNIPSTYHLSITYLSIYYLSIYLHLPISFCPFIWVPISLCWWFLLLKRSS